MTPGALWFTNESADAKHMSVGIWLGVSLPLHHRRAAPSVFALREAPGQRRDCAAKLSNLRRFDHLGGVALRSYPLAFDPGAVEDPLQLQTAASVDNAFGRDAYGGEQ